MHIGNYASQKWNTIKSFSVCFVCQRKFYNHKVSLSDLSSKKKKKNQCIFRLSIYGSEQTACIGVKKTPGGIQRLIPYLHQIVIIVSYVN